MNETIGNAIFAVGSGLVITYGGEAVAGSKAVQAIGSGITAAWDKVKNVFTKAEQVVDNGLCFTADTLIYTKNGHKEIREIKIGDEVYSENPETQEKGIKKVTEIFVNSTDSLTHIFYRNMEVKSTSTHPYWVIGRGWVKAKDIKISDKLLLYSGEVVEVKKIEQQQLEKPILVYNLEVEEWHTYYVSELNVLVHNACQDGDRVRAIANEFGITSKDMVKSFGRYVEEYKKGSGIPNKYTLDANTNRELAQEFLGD